MLARFPDDLVDTGYGRAVETLLWRCAGSTPPGLLALAARITEVGNRAARTCLIYFSSEASKNRREASVRRRVREVLLAREDDFYNVELLTDRWLASLKEGGSRRARRNAVAQLVALAARTDATAPDQPFIRAIVGRTSLFALIRENWPHPTPVPAGLARVFAAVDGGADVFGAAVAALNARRSSRRQWRRPSSARTS
ncbi:MAG TPA: hypothetical protein VKF14_02700 [Candidatus Dormibacteraeota bacterium]|nr:hypothetical protein [Candidatus Dormibacteraeota bacterium]